jgi:lysophospholipase L1-like esterase
MLNRKEKVFILSIASIISIFSIKTPLVLAMDQDSPSHGITIAESPNLKTYTKQWETAPRITSHYDKNTPASCSPLLTWTKNLNAVRYEVEFFTTLPDDLQNTQLSRDHIYFSRSIYSNGYNPPLEKFAPELLGKQALYWRVRAIDYDGNPISLFSVPEALYTDTAKENMKAPILTARYNQGNGTTLLYPVYSWIPNSGAKQFEIELLSAPPENHDGITPSRYRIAAFTTKLCDYYDKQPRSSSKPFYWRVRSLDATGNPIGVYSKADSFTVTPAAAWQTAVYGDSITHGGGHMSYGPSDWEYSYETYLNFPVINLALSGDTSEALMDRFDRDVLPFHPHYLIIMGGTNSLRGGYSADSVIYNLETIKIKCLKNNIKPIFLTLPPINPENIKKVFGEDSAPDWQNQMNLVNQYIRSQVYIDIAAALPCHNGILSDGLALDGLHLDVVGKKIMAQTINQVWPAITKQADEQTLPTENSL